MAPARPKPCSHQKLYTDISPHAAGTGFTRASIEDRLAAASHSGRAPDPLNSGDAPDPSTFPAPLVLPGDDIAEDPQQESDTLREFAQRKQRNRVTPERNTLYIIDAPVISDEVDFMNPWLEPAVPSEYPPPSGLPSDLARPQASNIATYLAAFYHGLAIKTLSSHYTYVPWATARTTTSAYIGLAHPDGTCTRIRHRPSPDAVSHQLNLSDLLDAVLASVPRDAYAVLLLAHHDTYESPSDDFCCGRAFGASRVSIVSSFRYHPALDAHNDVDRAHAWPASHCAWWVDAVCDRDDNGAGSAAAAPKGALHAAAAAARASLAPRGRAAWEAAWLASVCRTASHELGHCLGLAHCALYACVMQSTAGVGEDGRQPPYLCPVCLAKTAFAVAGEAAKGRGKAQVAEREARERAWVVERYRRIQGYCAGWKGTGVGMVKGYGAWAGHRVTDMEGVKE